MAHERIPLPIIQRQLGVDVSGVLEFAQMSDQVPGGQPDQVLKPGEGHGVAIGQACERHHGSQSRGAVDDGVKAVLAHQRRTMPRSPPSPGTGLDESVIQVARECLPPGTFEVADAMRLPFADDSFDLAVSTFGVSFLPGEPAVRELVRVVRDGGRIVITSWPERGSILSAGSILRRAMLEAQGRPTVVHDPTAWHNRSTVRDLFAPHSVESCDEQILYQAASPRAVAAQYYDHHPQRLRAREVVGEAVYAQLREQA